MGMDMCGQCRKGKLKDFSELHKLFVQHHHTQKIFNSTSQSFDTIILELCFSPPNIIFIQIAVVMNESQEVGIL